MEITIRNITKDTMVDFNNDHTITLPMDEEKLRNMLGNDEWIIVDGVPVCITRSNKRASDIMSYLSGYEVEINDGKLKKQLDKIRNGK